MGDSGGDLFREMFFEEAGELLETLKLGILRLGQGEVDRAAVDPVYRAAHSLKGAAAMVGLSEISELALSLERMLSRLRSGSADWSPELAGSLEAGRGVLAARVAEAERAFRDAKA